MRRVLCAGILLAHVFALSTAGLAAYDHPSDLFAAPETPSSDGADAGNGGSDTGSSGSSSGSESDPSPAETARQAETKRLISALEAAVEECQSYVATQHLYEAAARYQPDSLQPANLSAYALDTALVSAIQSGQETYAALDAARDERQRELGQALRGRTSEAVGDPIRLSDGAFLYDVPLPAISHWGLTLDLTLHYDDTQRFYGDLAPGWSWKLDERVIPGRSAIPNIEPAVQEVSDCIIALERGLSGWLDVAGIGDSGTPVSDVAVPILALAAELDRRVAALDSDIVALNDLGAEPPPEVIAARDEFSATATSTSLLASGVSTYVQHDRLASRAAEQVADWLREMRAFQDGFQADTVRLERSLPVGMPASEALLDSSTAVFLQDGRFGIPMLPLDGVTGLVSQHVPWTVLRRTHEGYVLEGPHEIRTFDTNGMLVAMEDRAGHMLRIDRSGGSRFIMVRDEHDTVRAELERGHDKIRLLMPDTEPIVIQVVTSAHGQREIAGIRGPSQHVQFAYAADRLSRIDPALGAPTTILREPTPTGRRVVTTTDEHEDRLDLFDGGRRVFIRSDGSRERYSVEDGRVRSLETASGEHFRFDYTPSGLLTGSTGPGGSRTDVRRDTRGAVVMVTFPDGSWRSTVRDHLGRVTEQASDRGIITRSSFDDQGRITVHQDARNVINTISWSSPRAFSVAANGESLASYELDASGNLIREQRFDGRETAWSYDPGGRIAGETVDGIPIRTWQYDRSGRLTSWRNEQGVFSVHQGQGGETELYRNGVPIGMVPETPRSPRPADPDTPLRTDAAHRPVWLSAPGIGEIDIEYDGLDRVRRYADGSLRREERDQLGRPIRTHYPDGTMETWAYHDHGRSADLIDRRGGRHAFSFDRYGRPVSATAPDGSVQSWEYSNDELIERFGDTELRHQIGPDSRIIRSEGPGLVATGTEFLSTGYPAVSWGVERDRAGGISAITSPMGTQNLRVTHRSDTDSRFELVGHEVLASRNDDTNAERIEMNAGRDVWNRSFGDAGFLSRMVAPGGVATTVSWDGPGHPNELVERRPDGQVSGWRIARAPNQLSRLDLANREVLQATWDPVHRQVEMRAGTTRRTLVFDPYGAVEHEAVSNPTLAVSRHAHLDHAGRMVVSSVEASHQGAPSPMTSRLSMAYTGAGYDAVAIDTGAGRISIRDTQEGLALAVPGTPVRHVSLSPGRIVVHDSVVLEQRPVPGHTAELRSLWELHPDGTRHAVDALLSLLSGSGQTRAERRLGGHTAQFEYGPGGELLGVPDPLGVHRSLPQELASDLYAAWRAAGIAVSMPTEAGPQSPLGMRPAPHPVWPPPTPHDIDYAGRITAIDEFRLAYDDTIGVPSAIHGPPGSDSWQITRSADGAPMAVYNETRDELWLCNQTTWRSSIGILDIRVWSRRPANDARNGGSIGMRYVERSSPHLPASEHPNPAEGHAVEIRVQGIPRVLITTERIVLPFLDRSATIRGLASISRRSGYVRYARRDDLNTPAPGGAALPGAVPWTDLRYGYWRIGDEPLLLSRHRLLLESHGVFSSRDPSLHGFDWYGHAYGDPVNLADYDGLRVVAVRSDLRDVQQGPLWAESALGSAPDVTIGSHGCALTSVSNIINSVAGERISNPALLNVRARDIGYFSNASLLSTESNRAMIEAATGHPVEIVSFEPEQVDMEVVARYLNHSDAARFFPMAQIETHGLGDRANERYGHFLNVSEIDSEGRLRFTDTSTRDRVLLSAREEIERIDVFVAAECRVY